MDRTYYDLFMSWRGLIFIIGLHVIPTSFLAGMLISSYVPLEILKANFTQSFPQIENVLNTEAVFIYDLKLNPMFKYFCGLVVILIVFVLTFIEGACVGFSLYQLRKAKSRLSIRAYKLHLNLCVALAIQMSLPLVMIYFPIVGIAIGAVYGLQHLTVWTEGALMFCTAHSILDSLVIIFGIRPYRVAILRFFRRSGPTIETSIYRSKKPYNGDGP
ncbi:hypothetical protein M3Y98_00944400 [Aphelenchoides besseyi]|nr:hypothetical protein M3Y98_00944400 [Aphelenchoides besseyi]